METRYPLIRTIGALAVILGWVSGGILVIGGFVMMSNTNSPVAFIPALILAAISIGGGFLTKELTVILADIADNSFAALDVLRGANAPTTSAQSSPAPTPGTKVIRGDGDMNGPKEVFSEEAVCTKCGTRQEVDDNTIFCDKCGAKLPE